MSILQCDRHDCRWDSDAYLECPLCEGERPEEISEEYLTMLVKAIRSQPDEIIALEMLREACVVIRAGGMIDAAKAQFPELKWPKSDGPDAYRIATGK